MSSTFELKFVLAKSPPDWPSPVKSKRSTAMPSSVRARAMRLAATASLLHVKQCANRANARIGPDGSSRRAARGSPCEPGNSTFSVVAAMGYRYSGLKPKRSPEFHSLRRLP